VPEFDADAYKRASTALQEQFGGADFATSEQLYFAEQPNKHRNLCLSYSLSKQFAALPYATITTRLAQLGVPHERATSINEICHVTDIAKDPRFISAGKRLVNLRAVSCLMLYSRIRCVYAKVG
jgi:hypothetical protein